MMHNFAGQNYICPFCLLRDGHINEYVESRSSDIVYADADVMAFIGSWQFLGTPHAGSTLVIPKVHFENIFELPDELAHRIAEVTKLVATSMRASFRCDGITIWQNNGPAATQTVFHFHTHIIPRKTNDQFFEICNSMKENFKFAPEEIRFKYAELLKSEIQKIA